VLVSSHLLAEIAQTVDDVVIIAKGRLVIQSSLADLADRTRPGVWVRTPQAQALRDALNVKGIAAELTTAETVEHSDHCRGRRHRCRRRRRRDLRDDSKHFDLEEYFLELTTPTTDRSRTRSRTELYDERTSFMLSFEVAHNSDDLWLGACCAGIGTISVFGAIVSAGKSGGGPALNTGEGIRGVMSAGSSGVPHRPDHRHLDHGRGVSPRHGDLQRFLVSPKRGRVVGAKILARSSSEPGLP